jgi:hypothetical protein
MYIVEYRNSLKVEMSILSQFPCPGLLRSSVSRNFCSRLSRIPLKSLPQNANKDASQIEKYVLVIWPPMPSVAYKPCNTYLRCNRLFVLDVFIDKLPFMLLPIIHRYPFMFWQNQKLKQGTILLL